MGMVAPLSHREIEAWQRLMQIGELDPLEIEALCALDAAMFATGEPEQEQVTLPTYKRHAWPSRKKEA